MKINTLAALSLLTAGSLMSVYSFAQPPQGPRGGKPPQEAIDACNDKESGEEVSFETPRGDTLEATCKMINDQLVAVPAGHNMKKED